jgi:hypothetical protein
MFTIRTGTDLTARDIRRLERHGYEILAIPTDHPAKADQNTLVCARQNSLDIPEHELPF